MKKSKLLFWSALGGYLLYRYSKLKVVHYKIQTPKVSKSTRLVLLSDLHSVSYGNEQQQLIDKVKAQQPDFVAIAGDIVDDRFDKERSWILLEKLSELYPCYFVTGNHEFKTRIPNEIKHRIRQMGITVLEGGTCNLGEITISGIDDVKGGKERFRRQYLKANEAAAHITNSTNTFNILLQHQPHYLKSFSRSAFDLMLSGHTHGGQVIIPRLANGVYAVGQGFAPQFAGGYYTLKDKHLIIGRGLTRNTRGIPRVFNPPELVVIDIEQS